MATDTASRASMDLRWGSDTSPKPSAERRVATMEEAARQTAGQTAIDHYASRTPDLVPADTHLNRDFVNDGAGGFKTMDSIAEIAAYGDAREARLTGFRPKDDGKNFITGVFHLPLSMCIEVPEYYPRVDKKTGEPIRNPDGTKMNRSRWVIRPGMEEEAQRYWETVIAFMGEILPGGIDAIHGGSVNLDESRPHMHLMFDPFEDGPTAKQPDGLKSAFSKVFSAHRSCPKVPQTHRTTGAVIIDEDTGKPKMITESGSRKVERYHKELKAKLIAAGFDIEAERDPHRHSRKLGLQDLKETRDALALAEAKTEDWEENTRPGLEVQAEEDMKMAFELVEEPKLRRAVTKKAVKAAEADAAKITEAANTGAEEILANARAQETRILEKARKEAEEEKEKAQKIKEKAEKTAKQEAEKIKADAKEKAKQEAQKIKEDARETAKTEAAGIKADAQTEADKTKADARTEAARITVGAEEEVKSLKADWAVEKKTQLADLTAKADELTEMQEQLPGLIKTEVEKVGKTLWKNINHDYRTAAGQVITRDGRPASEEIEEVLAYNRRNMTPAQLRLSELQTMEQKGRALREGLTEHVALAEAEAEAAALEEENENEVGE